MKILLIKPPLNPKLISTKRYEPLGLEYIAAAVSEYEVDIFDMRIEKNLMKKLRTFRPDVVGATAYTCNVNTVKRILKEVKLYDNNIKTVIGGHHATFVPQDFAEPFIDTIFIGYADQTFKDYIDIIANGGDIKSVNNVGFVENGGRGIFFTEQRPVNVDLDSLPMPARNLTQKYRYHNSYKKKVALLMSSRGCPFRCTFCACWKLMKGKYVTRNVESIIDELKSLPESVGIICFSDDNTIQDIKRAWKLSEMIKKHNIKKKFVMYARADTIVKHPDLLKSLKEAGFDSLTVGFESYKEEGLKKLNKRTSVEINNEAIRILKKLDIHIHAQFIVDPEFSLENFEELFQYVWDKCLFSPVFAVLTPLPGTELFKETSQHLAIKDYDFYDFAHSVLPTKLERDEFYKQLAALYKKSYSFQRFFHYKKIRSQKSLQSLENSPDFYAFNTDGMTFFKLVLVHIFTIFQFLKFKNAYKSEPVVQE
ncbi:MAG: radical SAM protein [Candidatus Aminicenantes bacterium]|nr:radical SAM protein [Candidatus Aminicenantes bacterium]NIM78195.1 radical SAM protein [Candidatus Aminicenantes bacterium]NIN17532.1 radical SAM protein [Candidatus Aminicenantes bacterium]NIN41418.1 radical SAM protein [Candidatus Aminicenantes bacterium]NIN84184.1 radical SAM protein [Candidatus Aminicenantes bacterium]